MILGVLLLMEGWREVYRASREGQLVTDGLYGVVRHPQYTGIMIAVFGQIVHWPTIITLALFPVIVLIYVRLSRKEEKKLIEQFGDEYVAYKQRVAMFFPRWGEWGRLFGAMSSSADQQSRPELKKPRDV